MRKPQWTLVVACCLVSGSLLAQSLAEIAKKEKERRKKSEKPVEVIDERDLIEARGSGGDIESSVTTGSDDDEGKGDPSSGPPPLTPSPPTSVSSSNTKCDNIRASLTQTQRRFNEGVTVTEKVPGRTARGVRTGYDSEGNVIISDVPTYENRTKKVSCSSAEGRKNRNCQSLQQRIDALRAELRTCHQ